VGSVFFSLLLVLALIDLEHKLLPNKLTLSGLAIGLLFSLLGWNLPFFSSLLGGTVGFALLFVIALISRGGMGMGDVKLMALIGSFLGWKAVFYVLFGGALFGSIGGLMYLYITKQDRKTPIPFGPSLALAAFLYYLLA
jgi:prepilin signal peptidase PulO-like enzyme (type II secretory pathway)